MNSSRPKRIMAVASGGGHWVQLLRLVPAFDGCVVHYVTTNAGYRAQMAPDTRFHAVADCNRHEPFNLMRCGLHMLWLLIRVRPDVVLSTGAAPGLVAIWLARRLGIRTAWIDSVANVDELSMSGRAARRCADLWLTQWEHLARPEGPQFRGNVF